MTTPEQQAREMLERMGVEGAQRMSAGELVELANLIAEHDALKAEFKIIDEMNDQLREQNEAVGEACAKLEAELAAIKGAGEPYCYVYEWDTEFGLIRNTRPGNFNGRQFDRVVPLYTHPCVPLTDEQRAGLLSAWRVAPKDEADFLKGITAAEAAHNIKGAKP